MKGNAFGITAGILVLGFWPGIALGGFGAIIWGVHEASWAGVWVGGIFGYAAGTLILGGVMALMMAFDDGPGAGSLDNPHKWGSTAWYQYENERREYFDS